MKVRDLIEILQAEIEEDSSFAKVNVLMRGEESGNMVIATSLCRTMQSVYLVSDEVEEDDE